MRFKSMKKTFLLFILSLVALASCHGSDNFNLLPEPVSKFITCYWPDPDVESVKWISDDKLVVILNGGPTLTFNGKNEWTSIDGNGMPLLEMLLFDRLPQPLYDYILSGSYINQVFSIARTPRQYTVELLDSTLIYDIEDGSIKQIHNTTL